MKKILTLCLLATMLLSAAACSKNNSDTDKDITAATTETVTTAPTAEPAVITLDQINAAIAEIKEEYATADEIKLSDGTVIKAEPKNPGITVESIKNGTSTEEQMANFAMYLSNIRKVISDKLASKFPVTNFINLGKDKDGKELGTYIFLDPKSAGYNNAVELIVGLSESDDDKEIKADLIIIQNNIVSYFNKDTDDAFLLCPTDEENAVLMAIAEKLNPDMLTEKVTETTAE